MAARSNRGMSSTPPAAAPSIDPSTDPRRLAARLRARSAVVAVAGAVLAAALAGCDNPANKAAKEAREATAKAVAIQPAKATAEPVRKAVEGRNMSDPAKAAESLAALGAIDAKRSGSDSEWVERLKVLGYEQRNAIATAMVRAPMADREAVIAALDAASKTANAPPEVKVDPLLRMAALEAQSGDVLTHQATLRDAEANRVAKDVSVILGSIRMNTARIAALGKADPAGILAGIDAEIAKINGADANATWITGEGDAKVLTIAAIDAKAKELTDKIQKLEAEHKAKTDEAAVADAAARKAEVDSKKGTIDHVMRFNLEMEAVNQRGINATRLREAEGLQAQVNDAKRELAIVSAGRDTAVKTRDALTARKAEVAKAWEDFQASKVAPVKAASERLIPPGGAAAPAAPTTESSAKPGAPSEVAFVPPANVVPALPSRRGSTPAGPASQPSPADLATAAKQLEAEFTLTTKLQRLLALAGEANALRADADKLYESARKHVNEAYVASTGAVEAIDKRLQLVAPTAPEKAVLDSRKAALSRAQFVYQVGEILGKKAKLAGDAAAAKTRLADARQEVEATLVPAGLAVPAEVAGGGLPGDAAASQPAGGAPTHLPSVADADAAVEAAYHAYESAEAALSPLLMSPDEGSIIDSPPNVSTISIDASPFPTTAPSAAAAGDEGAAAAGAVGSSDAAVGGLSPGEIGKSDSTEAGRLLVKAARGLQAHYRYARAGVLGLNIELLKRDAARKADATKREQFWAIEKAAALGGNVKLKNETDKPGFAGQYKKDYGTPPPGATREVLASLGADVGVLQIGVRATPPPATAPAPEGASPDGTPPATAPADGSVPPPPPPPAPADGSTPPAPPPAPAPAPTDGSTPPAPAPAPAPTDGSTPPAPAPTDGSTPPAPAPAPAPTDGSTPPAPAPAPAPGGV